MTYTYTLAELSALGATNLSILYRSLEADTASLRVPLQRPTSTPLPWANGDRIRIHDEREADCPRIFSGRVKRMNTTIASTNYAVQVELANDVDVLDSTIFAYIDESGKIHYAQSFYSARALGESPYGERLTSAGTVCERCFDWAKAGGAMDCELSLLFDSTILGVAGTGSQSCWSLIRQALKWVPDAASRMIYQASGQDTLCITTSRNNLAARIDVHSKTIDILGWSQRGSFGGIEAVALTPRPDLIPPVVAMTGRLQMVLPEDGNVRAPGAFIYHVRESGAHGASHEEVKKAAQAAALEMAPWQIVQGKAAPLTITNALGNVNRREKAAEAPAKILEWWGGTAGFTLLKKLGTSRLTFGKALFEPVAQSDAYPPDDTENPAPANYASPAQWGTLYLLTDGSFPARPEASENIGGLEWCRGKLSQYVWITPGSTLPSGVSREQVMDFFAGTHPVLDGNTKKQTRYALLTLDGVWINRRRVRYREGDNHTTPSAATMALSEAAETDAISSPTSPSGPDADYATALQDFFAATRKLYYDGSITLTDVRGCPGELLAHGINIRGLQPEWETMLTPCNAVDYDPILRRATLTLGSRDSLTIDELLERQDLGRVQAASRTSGDTDNPLDPTPDNDYSGSEGEGDASDYGEMVAPSINASIAAYTAGRPLNSWEAYPEGDKWYMNGGSVATPSGWVTVEAMDITPYYKPNRKFYAEWSDKAGKIIYRYVTQQT